MTALRTNAPAFNADLKEFAKQIDLDVGLVRRKVAIDLFSLCQSPEKATSDGLMVPGVTHPVDKGRARWGWAMSDEEPSSFVPPETGTFAGAPGDAHNTANFNKPFQITWIVNNVPYIGVLEFDDHSQQAQGGWIRKAISLLELSLNSSNREVR